MTRGRRRTKVERGSLRAPDKNSRDMIEVWAQNASL